MLKKHSQLFEGLFAVSDLIVVSAAWIFSYWLRFNSGLIAVDKGLPPLSDYLRMLLFLWLIWAFVFRRFGLYRPMRGTGRFREIWRVINANSFSVVLLLAATYLFREKTVEYSRLVFAIFWGCAIAGTVLSRSAMRIFLRAMRRRGYNLRYVLVVGSGSLAAKVVRRVLLHPEFGIELVGCLRRDPAELRARAYYTMARENIAPGPGAGGGAVAAASAPLAAAAENDDECDEDLPVIGIYEDLPRFLEIGGIDQVVVALPLRDHDKLEAVISSIGDAMVDVKVVPDVHRFVQLGSQIEEFDGLPVVSLASTPLCGVNRVFKRGLDLTIGSLLLIIFSPLLLIIALLVRLTSRGPVFFSQERVGLDGRVFRIYKFRTMTTDAEDNGACFAVRNDPRATLLGSFLRKTSLDELPQLVNVISGHMSLVGPRPERPVFIDEFRLHVPRYMLRHKVQAGMTGWAQVNGWRGNTSISRRIEHDLYYIEHWSLGLDIKILGMTLVNGFRNRNAY